MTHAAVCPHVFMAIGVTEHHAARAAPRVQPSETVSEYNRSHSISSSFRGIETIILSGPFVTRPPCADVFKRAIYWRIRHGLCWLPLIAFCGRFVSRPSGRLIRRMKVERAD